LLTVHLSIFISVFNQLDAQNLFHNKFYFMPLHVSSTCAHHQEVKIVIYSLWYHHTYRCDDTRGCVMQYWPPDDEHMCSKHVEAWNKTYCETNFVHPVTEIKKCWSTFKYLIILIVSIYCILCIGRIVKCLIAVHIFIVTPCMLSSYSINIPNSALI